MNIRPATLQDKEVIFQLAVEQCERYPALRPDFDKIRHQIRLAISSAQHFCRVMEDTQRKVRGVLLAMGGNNLWAQRQFAVVNLWVSDLPGGGATLLRNFRDWAVSRPAIRVAGIAPDLDVDPRVWDLVQRIGFKKHGGAYLLYTRGVAHGLV